MRSSKLLCQTTQIYPRRLIKTKIPIVICLVNDYMVYWGEWKRQANAGTDYYTGCTKRRNALFPLHWAKSSMEKKCGRTKCSKPRLGIRQCRDKDKRCAGCGDAFGKTINYSSAFI
jgi:hypothetical protein